MFLIGDKPQQATCLQDEFTLKDFKTMIIQHHDHIGVLV